MKIRQLFLKAFGPFTDATLDFTGPANLHIIFGPNEAGKSSALRAMGDLRYGVPVRSADVFLHESGKLRVAADFEDAAGRRIGLSRRKGQRDTLALADVDSGDAIVGSQVTPDILLALTGGVAREQFATMYGLDSAHLRAGGGQLIKGEGELGAALFEASTGSAGIRATLDALQADAKKYFAPRASSTVLAEATRQIDESKQRYRLALTKPDQWKTLNRAFEEAAAQLAGVRQQLADLRRQGEALATWRHIEPLLRQLDLAEAEWAGVADLAALPPDAREQRLAALQKNEQASEALTEAQAALTGAQGELKTLRMEAPLMRHASAIDRFGAEIAGVRRDADRRVQLAASTDAEAAQLRLQAQRLTGAAVSSLEAVFLQLPTGADQASLDLASDQFQTLTLARDHALAQRQTSADRLDALRLDELQPAPADQQQALAAALAQAQSLGDAGPRLVTLKAALTVEERQLAKSLDALGLADASLLTTPGRLPSASIDAHEKSHAAIVKRLELLTSQRAQLMADLSAQTLRQTMLAAEGEVVTADTLRQARKQRDGAWQTVRAVYIDKTATDGQAPSPQHFEGWQRDTDRQADLLREGATRAAEMAGCQQRIAEMNAALNTLEADVGEQTAAMEKREAGWTAQLGGLGIPVGTSAQVREWLAGRQTAKDQFDRLALAREAHTQLSAQIDEAARGLWSALTALGHTPPATANLSALVSAGFEKDKAMQDVRTAVARRNEDITRLAREVQQAEKKQSETALLLSAVRASLDAAAQRVSLAPGSPPDAIKARAAELQRWANDYQLHASQLGQVTQLLASEAQAARSAGALAALLGESPGAHAEAWFDDIGERLQQSRAAQARALVLEAAVAADTRRQQRAQAEIDAAHAVLAQLVQQAGVASVADLADAELASDKRREVARRLDDLKTQLAQITRQPIGAVRDELAGRDSAELDRQKEENRLRLVEVEAVEIAAIHTEQQARQALAVIDTSDAAAQAREEMEAAIARYRAGVLPWAQLKLAQALLEEALKRYREKAQGPLIALASDYFSAMTGGRFVSLWVDEAGVAPVLKVRPADGAAVAIDALSEGTADQLYLALRLAALEVQRQPDRLMPLVLDDVLITSDDERAASTFKALEKFAAHGQVLVFTHHRHLVDIAQTAVGEGALKVHELPGSRGPALDRSVLPPL